MSTCGKRQGTSDTPGVQSQLIPKRYDLPRAGLPGPGQRIRSPLSRWALEDKEVIVNLPPLLSDHPLGQQNLDGDEGKSQILWGWGGAYTSTSGRGLVVPSKDK